MPRLAAFPKAYMDALCVDGCMTLDQRIALAAQLDIDGLELYCGILDLRDPMGWNDYRRKIADHGLCMPMLCCSPDFTHPDPAFRAQQVEWEMRWIDMTAELGGMYCRVLSGQRRPEVSRADGVRYAAGFDGWISIEDGVDGFEQLQRSAAFLRRKIAQHWG